MIKKVLNFLKDYLTVIAVIPLILGGIWQTVSLISISPSYLRFFSVSQQIADGIAIIVVIGSLYTVIVITRWAFKSDIKVENLIERSNTKLFFTILYFIIWTCFILFIQYLAIFGPSRVPILSQSTETFKLYGLSLSLVLVTTSCLLIVGFYNLYLSFAAIFEKNNIKLEFLKKKSFVLFLFFLSIFFGLIPFLIIGFVETILFFHNELLIPRNLININYVIDKYCEENDSATRDSLKLLYVNDKYIFIQNRQKVEVVKFDYMFKEDKIELNLNAKDDLESGYILR